METGFTGCSPYYPEDGSTEIHLSPFKITLKDINEEQDSCERILVISREGSGETQELIHLQFKSWPNYGVPDETGPISEFIRLTHLRANNQQPEKEFIRPELVVHCSGGIGRTGTFLAAYQTFSDFEKLSKGLF